MKVSTDTTIMLGQLILLSLYKPGALYHQILERWTDFSLYNLEIWVLLEAHLPPYLEFIMVTSSCY